MYRYCVLSFSYDDKISGDVLNCEKDYDSLLEILKVFNFFRQFLHVENHDVLKKFDGLENVKSFFSCT